MKDKCFFFLQRHFCMCPPDVKGHKKLWTETRCYCQEPFLGGLLVLEFENCCWCQRSASVRIPWCCQNITQTFSQDDLETKMGGWPSGIHLVMEMTKNTNKYYAIGYTYSSKKIISFISTSQGHTNAGEPHVANWVDRNNRQLRRDIPLAFT